MAHLEDEARPDYWHAPKDTANAKLLAGYIGGAIEGDGVYRLITLSNPLEIENRENGNRYRVMVEQIAGQE